MGVSALLIVLLLVAAVILYTSRLRKENYGPPPGAARAVELHELGDRGWATWDQVFHGNSASSMSQFMERSA